MNFDLNRATVYLAISGSRAYGFNTTTSDWDYRGIAIPPIDTYIGLKPKFEQAVDAKTKHVWKLFPEGLIEPEADMQVMELTKFCNLALTCNPSIIEILFSDHDSIVRMDPIMDQLIANRDMFLSKQARPRFCGYAVSQLRKIKSHRRWITDGLVQEPTRASFDLPEYSVLSKDQLGAANSMIEKEAAQFVIDQNGLNETTKTNLQNNLEEMMKSIWVALNKDEYPVGLGKKFASTKEALYSFVASQGQFSENFLEVLKREKQYRAAKQDWDSYQHWLRERNPARAEMEKKFGFDLKYAVHLVRLVRMCREILETGQVHVKRPDAEELREIRNGAWTYERVCEYAESEDKELLEVARASKLPSNPDFEKAHRLVFETVTKYNTTING